MFLFRWVTAPFRMAVKIVVLLVAAVVVYYAVGLVQVWLTSRQYEPVRTQAIVVMGAAQHDGVPSPDLQARLDQARTLYEHHDAPLIVCTGSTGSGGTSTEAGSGKAYLVSKGVPAGDIVEAGGSDIWTEIAQAAAKLEPQGDTNVLIVTDPFREYRSMAIATDVGLTPHPTPAQTSPITGAAAIPHFLETAGWVALGRIVGYKPLHRLAGLAGLGS